MIDPKFNELPIENEGDFAETVNMTEEERAEFLRRRKASGLSINDTIAANANLSIGARGADTSGVEAGKGAGAGSTMVTPVASDSAAPQVAPAPRGTGSTPRVDTKK